MIEPIKPENPSEKDYLSLSKEFNKKGLLYPRYKQLLRYEEVYGSIDNNPKYTKHLSNKSEKNEQTRHKRKQQKHYGVV